MIDIEPNTPATIYWLLSLDDDWCPVCRRFTRASSVLEPSGGREYPASIATVTLCGHCYRSIRKRRTEVQRAPTGAFVVDEASLPIERGFRIGSVGRYREPWASPATVLGYYREKWGDGERGCINVREEAEGIEFMAMFQRGSRSASGRGFRIRYAHGVVESTWGFAVDAFVHIGVRRTPPEAT